MKYLESILYLEFTDLIDAGISENTLKAVRLRSSTSWIFAKDPDDKRRLLVRYDTLKDKYKKQITAYFGDPYQYMSDQVLQRYLILTPQDQKILEDTRISDHRLSIEQLKRYSDACRYLNMLASLSTSQIRSLGFASITGDFYPAVLRMIKANKINLPCKYITLKRKVSEYSKNGANAVINGRMGNCNSRKVDNVGEAALKELLSRHNNYNAEQIAIIYNGIARARGLKELTGKTVLRYAMGLEVLAGRTGTAQWRDLYDRVIHRSRPSRPGMLWVGDATPYELYFQKKITNGKGHQETKYWMRKVVYVVIDAFNDLVMGYSIGETESTELSRLAWKNACLNSGILPDQVKVDHFAIKELTPMYSKIALNMDYFTPAAVGNARDKVVESFFARLYDQVVRMHPNAAGRNIQAKEKPNRDKLDQIKHDFPDEEMVIKMIDFDLKTWNNMQRVKLGNKSLMQQWIEGDLSQARKLDDFKYLDCFGKKHNYTNRLTSRGLQVSIGGTTRTYMRDDIDLYKTVGTSYEVYYVEDDPSRILISADEGRLQYVLEEEGKIPMAYGDFKPGDREKLNGRLNFKKEVAAKLVREPEEKRRQLLKEHGIMNQLEADAIVKSMFRINGHQKELLYAAGNVLKGDVQSNEEVVDDLYDGDMYKQAEQIKEEPTFNDGY